MGDTVSSLDAASKVLNDLGPMTAMKLQKLCYYCQAWSLVWDEAPLFDDRIEAWANGPVITRLYSAHRGQFVVESLPGGDVSRLSIAQQETIDVVLRTYGPMNAADLSALTHRERPWLEAREGLLPGQRGSVVIEQASMAEYYGALL